MTAPHDEGPGRSASVVLSGEQVRVDVQWVASGRVRLRRRIVSETRTIEVVVRREELIVETADIAGLDPDGLTWVGTALDGPPVPEPGAEPLLVLPLREEVPQVSVTTRVYEQATLHRRWQTTVAPVTVPARHEQADVHTTGRPADR